MFRAFKRSESKTLDEAKCRGLGLWVLASCQGASGPWQRYAWSDEDEYNATTFCSLACYSKP